MALMPKGADPPEEPVADPGEQTAREPQADIVARQLEYQRRLREESEGEPPTLEGVRVAPPAPAVERGPPELSTEAEPEPEPRAAETEPAPRRPDDASEASDERQLRERIERLDETLARISSMPPLLRDGTEADPER